MIRNLECKYKIEGGEKGMKEEGKSPIIGLFLLLPSLLPSSLLSILFLHSRFLIIKIFLLGHLYFRLDIIPVKGLSKHTLNTYISGTKIDPKYTFLHTFFLISPPCPFQNLSPPAYPGGAMGVRAPVGLVIFFF